MDVELQSPVQYLSFIVYIAGMIYGANAYKKVIGNGFLSYGKAFSVSYVIAMIAAVIGVIYSLILTEVIDPSIMTRAMEASEQRLIDRGMTDAQIEQAMSFSERFSNPGARAVMGLVFSAIVLAIIALITSIFVKKEEEL